MTNLVICCDGTWNNPQQEDNGIPSPTNVVKLYNALAAKDKNGIEQKKYYHPGLGGEDSGLDAASAVLGLLGFQRATAQAAERMAKLAQVQCDKGVLVCENERLKIVFKV